MLLNFITVLVAMTTVISAANSPSILRYLILNAARLALKAVVLLERLYIRKVEKVSGSSSGVTGTPLFRSTTHSYQPAKFSTLSLKRKLGLLVNFILLWLSAASVAMTATVLISGLPSLNPTLRGYEVELAHTFTYEPSSVNHQQNFLKPERLHIGKVQRVPSLVVTNDIESDDEIARSHLISNRLSTRSLLIELIYSGALQTNAFHRVNLQTALCNGFLSVISIAEVSSFYPIEMLTKGRSRWSTGQILGLAPFFNDGSSIQNIDILLLFSIVCVNGSLMACAQICILLLTEAFRALVRKLEFRRLGPSLGTADKHFKV